MRASLREYICCSSFSDAVSSTLDAMAIGADARLALCAVTLSFIGATVAEYPQSCDR